MLMGVMVERRRYAAHDERSADGGDDGMADGEVANVVSAGLKRGAGGEAGSEREARED
jgi:hypothetical protein